MRCSCAAHTTCDALGLSATMGRSWMISSLPCDSLSTTFFSVGWGFFSPCLVLLDARHHAVFLFCRHQIIVLVLLHPKILQLWVDRNAPPPLFWSRSLPCPVMAPFFLKWFPLARCHATYVIFFPSVVVLFHGVATFISCSLFAVHHGCLDPQ